MRGTDASRGGRVRGTIGHMSARQPGIVIGTSGYSYDDWVGPVYPEGTPKGEFLSLYAQRFSVVELNFSYYQQPGARTLARMIESTPEGFLFALKAHRSMTHEIGDTWEKDIAVFREGIRPLVEAGRLAAVLLQFPYSFAYTAQSRTRLAELCGRLEGLPLAVEFRKSDWLKEHVLEGLRERGVALVSVDEPDLPRLLDPATSHRGFLLHPIPRTQRGQLVDGRQREPLRLPVQATSSQDGHRVKDIFARARMVMIFFNNHFRGQAVENARQFSELPCAQNHLLTSGGGVKSLM